jgi:micrococcal nuclease
MTAFALALLLALPQPFEGRVVAVHDSDTISVLQAGRSVRVPLHGIDCPEQGQAFGRAAKQARRAYFHYLAHKLRSVGVDLTA